MKWFGLLLIIICFGVVCPEDSLEIEEISQENDRDTRVLSHEGWRAVDTVPEGNMDWIPKEQSSDQPPQHAPRRRRLRKRKRRPQLQENSEVSLEDIPLKRRPRPQPWEEMDDDMLTKPNIRRRVPPPYESSHESVDELVNPGSTRSTSTRVVEEPRPLEATILVQNEEPEPERPEKRIADLKALLKQSSGSLSLSEILQEKNITLQELLNGNQKAISALRKSPIQVTESTAEEKTVESDSTTKYKRLPPSIALKKNISRHFEQDAESAEMISNKEMLEAQRRRLALLHGHKENKIFSAVTKYDVVTEPMTEKRIFVPSHPKYYTSLSYKPDMTILEQSTEPILKTTEQLTTSTSTTTTTEPPKKVKPTDRMYLKPKLKGISPTTTTKIKITTKAAKKSYHLGFDFPDPFKIKLTEVAGFKDIATNEKHYAKPFDFPEPLDVILTKIEKTKDEPLRVPIEIMVESTTVSTTTKMTTRRIDDVLPTQSTEGSPYITAKEEINEVLKDEQSREKLSKILEVRNMTIDELVEQRERGSSQLHLADIFHNKTREPEPKDAPLIGQIVPDVPKTFNRQQKSNSFKDVTTDQYASILNVNPTETSKETAFQRESTHFPTVKIDNKVQSFSWKQKYPDLFPELFEKDKIVAKPDIVGSAEEVHLAEETNNRISLSSNEQFGTDIADDEGFFMNIPSSVKSAIFVSFAIIGLSIIVFLTIFVIFRLSQRHKRRLNYSSSLTTKLRSPIIMQSSPTNAIRSFMTDTLGNRKHYYKSNVQTISDDIWECERNRKESF